MGSSPLQMSCSLQKAIEVVQGFKVLTRAERKKSLDVLRIEYPQAQSKDGSIVLCLLFAENDAVLLLSNRDVVHVARSKELSVAVTEEWWELAVLDILNSSLKTKEARNRYWLYLHAGISQCTCSQTGVECVNCATKRVYFLVPNAQSQLLMQSLQSGREETTVKALGMFPDALTRAQVTELMIAAAVCNNEKVEELRGQQAGKVDKTQSTALLYGALAGNLWAVGVLNDVECCISDFRGNTALEQVIWHTQRYEGKNEVVRALASPKATGALMMTNLMRSICMGVSWGHAMQEAPTLQAADRIIWLHTQLCNQDVKNKSALEYMLALWDGRQLEKLCKMLSYHSMPPETAENAILTALALRNIRGLRILAAYFHAEPSACQKALERQMACGALNAAMPFVKGLLGFSVDDFLKHQCPEEALPALIAHGGLGSCLRGGVGILTLLRQQSGPSAEGAQRVFQKLLNNPLAMTETKRTRCIPGAMEKRNQDGVFEPQRKGLALEATFNRRVAGETRRHGDLPHHAPAFFDKVHFVLKTDVFRHQYAAFIKSLKWLLDTMY